MSIDYIPTQPPKIGWSSVINVLGHLARFVGYVWVFTMISAGVGIIFVALGFVVAAPLARRRVRVLLEKRWRESRTSAGAAARAFFRVTCEWAGIVTGAAIVAETIGGEAAVARVCVMGLCVLVPSLIGAAERAIHVSLKLRRTQTVARGEIISVEVL